MNPLMFPAPLRFAMKQAQGCSFAVSASRQKIDPVDRI
jgi:hypothetical protein